jgi:hypothetical protein
MNTEKIRASLKQIESLVKECLEAIGDQGPARRVQTPRPIRADARARSNSLDLTLPFRAFVNEYAHDMSGREKFTLVLAHVLQGDLKAESTLETITRAWNRTKGSLGNFNVAYTTRAKDKGWVDSPRTGVYVLRPSWTEILGVEK